MNRRELIAFVCGAAAISPLAASAQGKAMPVIGILGSQSGAEAAMMDAFQQGLQETGYVEQQNVAIEYCWAEGNYGLLSRLVAELLGRKVDIIAAFGAPAALAAKGATKTVPIVFVGGDDPIATGLVTNLARPRGNITGISFLNAELDAKRLELLCELVPQAKLVALLVNPNFPATERVIRAVQEGARAKGVQLTVLKASTEAEIDAAFAILVQQEAGALVVGADPFLALRREQLVGLAARIGVPAIYHRREFATAGGLISYGTSLAAVFRQTGVYVGRVLNGTKPADLPVQQPTTFELVINLTAAKSLDLSVPISILARATEVIE